MYIPTPNQDSAQYSNIEKYKPTQIKIANRKHLIYENIYKKKYVETKYVETLMHVQLRHTIYISHCDLFIYNCKILYSEGMTGSFL